MSIFYLGGLLEVRASYKELVCVNEICQQLTVFDFVSGATSKILLVLMVGALRSQLSVEAT
jgi:hypothetical protein